MLLEEAKIIQQGSSARGVDCMASHFRIRFLYTLYMTIKYSVFLWLKFFVLAPWLMFIFHCSPIFLFG